MSIAFTLSVRHLNFSPRKVRFFTKVITVGYVTKFFAFRQGYGHFSWHLHVCFVLLATAAESLSAFKIREFRNDAWDTVDNGGFV